MAPVVYTSSMAVFTAEDADPLTGRLTATAHPHPPNHYGVYKQANEGNARIYWLDSGLSSVGLRPMTVYGVGRDQGMTSGPTKAIVAAVLGMPYRVSFSGPTLYQYARTWPGASWRPAGPRSRAPTSSTSRVSSRTVGPSRQRSRRSCRALPV